MKYWGEFPPAHILLRGFVGWKPREPEKREWMPSAVVASAKRLKVLPDHLRREAETRKLHA